MSDTSEATETKTEEQAAKPAPVAVPEPVTIVNVGDPATAKLESKLTFTLDWTDEETGKRLVGTFEATRPNIAMVQQIAVIKARYNGGENISRDIDFINEMMAYCDVVLTDVPKWWTPSTFYSATPLRKVWDHVRHWENSFRKSSMGQRP